MTAKVIGSSVTRLARQRESDLEAVVIPYIHINKFGFIEPFGLLVGIGIALGYLLGRRRARLTGLDPNLCADGMVWTVVTGFVVAHLVSVIFYFPEKILSDPLVLLKFWAGISSFGGFIGGAAGAFIFFKRNNASVLKYADAIIFGLVPGWFFGRLGCTIASDHIGKPTDFVLGFQYPKVFRRTTDGRLLGGTRHNLGFYEMLYTIVLNAVLYATKGIRPIHGFHPALVLMLYAPVRFALDTLRDEDKLYLGYTPGQYFAGGMFLFAAGLILYGIRLRKAGDWPGASAAAQGSANQPRKAKAKGKGAKSR
ncbi:MAG: prolipoprotein diacylglyceryl transferase [Deltaproteobacteria bacterium]|nr:prolipoprotein diacylglyceryl transferase [Deltaproteobacteria bacterium]